MYTHICLCICIFAHTQWHRTWGTCTVSSWARLVRFCCTLMPSLHRCYCVSQYFSFFSLCVSVCFSVFHCVTVCCSVFQCVAVCCIFEALLACSCYTRMFAIHWCCSALQCIAVRAAVRVAVCVAVCCTVLHCVIVFFSVQQCVALCCSLLQCVEVCCSLWARFSCSFTLTCVEAHRNASFNEVWIYQSCSVCDMTQ